MRIYFAPMEGTTGYIYRRLHHRYFGGVDKYYTPFLSPTKDPIFGKREKRDILPENNAGIPTVPQLLTCRAEDFNWAADALFDLGYPEVNLNLGCPSGTVTAKKKGSGFLAFPEELDRFLEEIFSHAKGPISIKTRIGVTDPEEFPRLMEIYNRYPVCELTIHPRVRKEFYKGSVHLDVFREALEKSKVPLCYNGDLTTAEEYRRFRESFPEVEHVMIGRGLVADPALAEKIKGEIRPDRERMKEFHDALYEEYCVVFESSRNAMMRMKEHWYYHINLYADSQKLGKKLKKATDSREYEAAAAAVFRELELLPGPIPEWRKESADF